MGINSSDILRLLAGNTTSGEELKTQEDLNNRLLALKVFSITAVCLAIIILIASVIICGISYHKRNRQYRRAREYEDAVKHNTTTSPVDVTGVRRVFSIHKPLVLMRKRESSRHSSQVYFIYNNPVMSADESGVQENIEQPEDRQMSVNHKITSDSKSTGIILNPRVFYV